MARLNKNTFASFRELLQDWFRVNKRDLPWRTANTWYSTFLSEIILQQTTVDQGLPYYQKFIQKHPTIKSLANSTEQDVLALWAGLGYYSRARNLLKAAKIIVNDFNYQFPQDYKQAITLPGIGPYSASAILSMAYGLPYAVVDGNVIRVISRLFAISDDTRKNETLKRINEKATILLDNRSPGTFNEAIMELGAMVCKKANPECNRCPISNFCNAHKSDLTSRIPYKSPAMAKRKIYNFVLLLKHKDFFCIARNPQKGLLAGMWGFPVVAVKKAEFMNYKVKNSEFFGINAPALKVSEPQKQLYSHIELSFKAILINVEKKNIIQDGYEQINWVQLSELNQFPIHNAHKKVISWYKSIL